MTPPPRPEQTADTRYSRATEVWQWGQSGMSAQLTLLRWTLYSLMLLLLLSILGNIMQARSNRVQVHVVEVTEAGRVKAVLPPAEPFAPALAMQHYFLSEWIQSVRSVPSDRVVFGRRIFRAYAQMVGEGKRLLAAYVDEHLRDRIGTELVTVEDWFDAHILFA